MNVPASPPPSGTRTSGPVPGRRAKPPAPGIAEPEERPTAAFPPPARSGRAEALLLFAAAAVVIVPSWISSRRGEALDLEGEPAGAPRLDIRSAPWYEWILLEGIGEARARRIVEHRERRGGFRSLDDLRDVPGLPRDWLEKVRPYLFCGPAAGEGGTPPRQRVSGDASAELEDGN